MLTSFAQANAALKQFAPSKVTRQVYTLEYIKQFMDFLGNPQNKLKVIHVAGTSGKTSTSYYIASLIKAAGKKVGLSVSPHVDELNERLQIDLVPMREPDFCQALDDFLAIVNQSNIELTYFELLTAFAYWQFARQKVDYAVMEVGLGGALDATNVADAENKVCVITDVGLDHLHVLGKSLDEIARAKAGIVKFRNLVICHRQEGEIVKEIQERCRHKQADLHIVDQPALSKEYNFLPNYQKRNFGLALEVVNAVLSRDGVSRLNDNAMLHAAKTYIPGRMEVFNLKNKTAILDGAHNEQKFAALAESLNLLYPGQNIASLAAFRAGHSDRVEACTKVLTALSSHIIVTTYGQPDGDEPYGEDPDLVAAMCKIHGFWHVEAISSLAHAWNQLLARPEPILLVTGSLYLFHPLRPNLPPSF